MNRCFNLILTAILIMALAEQQSIGRPLLGAMPKMPPEEIVTNPPGYQVTTFASGLVVPWDIAFISKNRIYVTERPGRVRLIENGRLASKPYAVIPVAAIGEGGR